MRRTLVCCALAATAAGIAGCSSSGSSGGGGSTNPQSDPKSTVTAFIAALKIGDVGTVCTYVQIPAQQGSCPDLLGQALAGRGAFSGDATVANDVISGDKAIVVTTGNFSVFGTSVSNTDPSAGLPSGSTSFDAAYSAALADPKSPDLCLVKTGDSWFITPSSG